MTDQQKSATTHAGLSPTAIDAALSSARACITYDNHSPGGGGYGPAYPFPDGGFWGEFERRVAGRRDQL